MNIGAADLITIAPTVHRNGEEPWRRPRSPDLRRRFWSSSDECVRHSRPCCAHRSTRLRLTACMYMLVRAASMCASSATDLLCDSPRMRPLHALTRKMLYGGARPSPKRVDAWSLRSLSLPLPLPFRRAFVAPSAPVGLRRTRCSCKSMPRHQVQCSVRRCVGINPLSRWLMTC